MDLGHRHRPPVQEGSAPDDTREPLIVRWQIKDRGRRHAVMEHGDRDGIAGPPAGEFLRAIDWVDPILRRRDGQRLERRTAHRWVARSGSVPGSAMCTRTCFEPLSSWLPSTPAFRCETSSSQPVTPTPEPRPSTTGDARTSTATLRKSLSHSSPAAESGSPHCGTLEAATSGQPSLLRQAGNAQNTSEAQCAHSLVRHLYL